MFQKQHPGLLANLTSTYEWYILFRLCKHVESNYISQPPKYLLLIANQFRYTNNNVTKDICSLILDTTVMLGPLKFSLRATIDHHGPSIHSRHYSTSISCCNKNSNATTIKITEFEIINSKNSPTAYVVLFELIELWVLESNKRVGVCLLPWHWHILSIPLITGRWISAVPRGLNDVFPPDDHCSRP